MFSNETQENPLFELVRQRRTVRRYTGEKVSDVWGLDHSA